MQLLHILGMVCLSLDLHLQVLPDAMWDVPEPTVTEEDDEAEADEEPQGLNGAGPVSAVPKVRLTPLDTRQGSAVEVRSPSIDHA